MPAMFIPALISGLSALTGGLLNRPQEQKNASNTTSNTDQTQTTNASGTSMPTYDPYQLQMRNYLISQFYNRSNPAYINELVNSSLNQGTNAINESAAPQTQAIQNALAQRGLSYSGTAGTALAGAEQGRIGQINALQAQKPLLQDQLQGNNLTSFASYLSGLPTGTSTTATGVNNTQGTTNTQGTSIGTQAGNPLGAAVAGGGSALSLLYGLGAFGGGAQKAPQPSTTGFIRNPYGAK